MTPEQQAEFNRIAVKTEALEDSRDDSGFKDLKISGYADVNYVYNFNKERGHLPVPGAQLDRALRLRQLLLRLGGPRHPEGDRRRHQVPPHPHPGSAPPATSSAGPTSSTRPPSPSRSRPSTPGSSPARCPTGRATSTCRPPRTSSSPTTCSSTSRCPYVYTGVGIEKPLGKWVLKGMVANVNTPIRQHRRGAPGLRLPRRLHGRRVLGPRLRLPGGHEDQLPGRDATPPPRRPTTPRTPGRTRSRWTAGTPAATCPQRPRRLRPAGEGRHHARIPSPASCAPPSGTAPRSWPPTSSPPASRASCAPTTSSTTRTAAACSTRRRRRQSTASAGPTRTAAIDPEKGADKYAITAGVNYAINANATFKLEYRYDGATQNVFGNKGRVHRATRPRSTSSPTRWCRPAWWSSSRGAAGRARSRLLTGPAPLSFGHRHLPAPPVAAPASGARARVEAYSDPVQGAASGRSSQLHPVPMPRRIREPLAHGSIGFRGPPHCYLCGISTSCVV